MPNYKELINFVTKTDCRLTHTEELHLNCWLEDWLIFKFSRSVCNLHIFCQELHGRVTIYIPHYGVQAIHFVISKPIEVVVYCGPCSTTKLSLELRSPKLTFTKVKISLYLQAKAEVSLEADASYSNQLFDLECYLVGVGAKIQIGGYSFLQDQKKFLATIHIYHLANNTNSSIQWRVCAADYAHGKITAISYAGEIKESVLLQDIAGFLIGNNSSIILEPMMSLQTNVLEAKHKAFTFTIDPKAVKYLSSRGLYYHSIEKLMMNAFLNPITWLDWDNRALLITHFLINLTTSQSSK